MKSRRLIYLSLVAALALVLADGWSYWMMTRSKDDAQAALADAQTCQTLGAQMVAMQSKPAVANSQEQAFEQLTARIEAAAQSSGIAGSEHLAAIDPEPAARLGDTAYLEKPTVIQLREATLPQIVTLLSHLTQSQAGLRVKALRLSAPPQKEDTDLWSAQITLTYLIYSPLPTGNLSDQRS